MASNNYIISEAFSQLSQMNSKKKLKEDTNTKESSSKKVNPKKINEELKIVMSMSNYEPWSGAVDTYEKINDAGLWDNFCDELEMAGYEYITETELNDLLWFEPDFCLSLVGMSEYEEVDEALKNPFKKSIKESKKKKSGNVLTESVKTCKKKRALKESINHNNCNGEDCKEEGCNKNKKELSEAPVYDLHPQHDSRKSFYSKARVDTGDNNDKNKLYSYNTLVAEIKDGKPVVYGTYSVTTLRHIKEWLKQNGFKADSAKQIMKDYGVKEECLKEAKGANRYSFEDMMNDGINFFDSMSVKDSNGNKGTRYLLSDKLTDEQIAKLKGFDNIVISSATYKNAPEIKHDSIIILDKPIKEECQEEECKGGKCKRVPSLAKGAVKESLEDDINGDVKDILENKVNELFAEVQNKYGVKDGGLPPELDFELEDAEKEFTRALAKMLKFQIGNK